RDLSRATVYVALKRLEEKRLLTSRLGDSTPERGGRAKRFFAVKPAGPKALRESHAMFKKLWREQETILGRASPQRWAARLPRPPRPPAPAPPPAPARPAPPAPVRPPVRAIDPGRRSRVGSGRRAGSGRRSPPAGREACVVDRRRVRRRRRPPFARWRARVDH